MHEELKRSVEDARREEREKKKLELEAAKELLSAEKEHELISTAQSRARMEQAREDLLKASNEYMNALIKADRLYEELFQKAGGRSDDEQAMTEPFANALFNEVTIEIRELIYSSMSSKELAACMTVSEESYREVMNAVLQFARSGKFTYKTGEKMGQRFDIDPNEDEVISSKTTFARWEAGEISYPGEPTKYELFREKCESLSYDQFRNLFTYLRTRTFPFELSTFDNDLLRKVSEPHYRYVEDLITDDLLQYSDSKKIVPEAIKDGYLERLGSLMDDIMRGRLERVNEQYHAHN